MPDDKGTGAADTPNKGEKLAGKYETPEALEKAYKELDTKLGSMGTENAELRKFVENIAPYFVLDPKTGDVGFNEVAIKAALDIKDEGTSGDKKKDTQKTTGEKVDSEKQKPTEDFDARLEKMLEEKLGKFAEMHISPLAQEIDRKKADDWIKGLTDQHSDFPDFKDKILEVIKEDKIDVKNKKQLERIYHAVKGMEGGYVDKKAVEAERQDLAEMMRKTGTVFHPASDFTDKTPEDTTGKDLLGLPEDFGKVNVDSKLAQTLTGKPPEMLDPD